jgi:hypothetical protein
MGARMLFSQIDFANLHSGNYRDTSPATEKYNCIAWAAGVDDDWWGPEKNELGQAMLLATIKLHR